MCSSLRLESPGDPAKVQFLSNKSGLGPEVLHFWPAPRLIMLVCGSLFEIKFPEPIFLFHRRLLYDANVDPSHLKLWRGRTEVGADWWWLFGALCQLGLIVTSGEGLWLI